MKKLIYVFHLLLGLQMALSGCSEEVEPKPLTYSQLLTGTTSKTWRFTGFQIVEADKPPATFDAREVFIDCIADDLYVFYADKDRKFEIHEGSSKCDPADPDIFFTDTWSVVNATASINFIFPPFATGTYTLKSITETTMVVEYYVKEFNFSYRFILPVSEVNRIYALL